MEKSSSQQQLRPPAKKSYQFRALARKTLSYQKRQWFTNICCVGCCPFLMVAICGILSITISALLGSLNKFQAYTYCSDVNATDFETGLPYFDTSKIPYETYIDKKGVEQKRYSVNFYDRSSCVDWFSQEYPFQYPYSPGPTNYNCSFLYDQNLCPGTKMSTTYSQPSSGWLQDLTTNSQNAAIAFGNLFANQVNSWAWVSTIKGADYGSLPRESPIPLFSPGKAPTTSSGTGFLSGMEKSYYTLDNLPELLAGEIKFEARPYYENVDAGGDFANIDNKLNEHIQDLIRQFEAIQLPTDATDEQKKNFTIQSQKLISQLPHAVVLFDTVSLEKMEYTLQIGTNRRLSYLSTGEGDNSTGSNEVFSLPTFPPEGKRRLIHQTKLTQAFVKSNPQLQNVTIVQGLRVMPAEATNVFSLPIGSFVGEILYPFGVSFLLPVFVVSLVKEKEDRILMMMKMNGMKSWAYWLTTYVHFYSLHIMSTIVFIVTGHIFRLEFFTLTDPGAYILFFFIWGNTQIALAFVLSTFFNRSRPALLLVFCLVLAGVIINIAIGSLFTGEAPIGYLVWPPFAFYRAVSVMNKRAFTAEIPDYVIGMLKPGDEAFNCLISLILSTTIMFFLGVYLTLVLPSEYGIQKPWYFIFSDPYKLLFQKKNEAEMEKVEIDIDESDELLPEDEDVKDERKRVYNNEHNPQCPVVMRDMRKQFSADKVAVKSVTLAIDPNSVFGLLGPNGAGKTTLINILTGLYPPSAGDSRLAGFIVGEEMKEIYMNIGVCPQHDILWDDLTVEEHLLFYARIKGVEPHEEKDALNKALETVSLQNFKQRLSKGLSGGEKRRLSIAISLIGDPKVVFLDEPTTGLDPEVRRLIWDIVNKARNGRTVILTTHSMEEAEVLCQRIGIMAKGTLRCLGPQVRLKNKYGSGFKLSFSCDPKDQAKISQYIESLLPAGWKLLDNFAGNSSYEFNGDVKISTLFKEIGEHKDEYGIQFWGISQTSLEEVFLRIIKEADAEAY